MVFSLVNCEFIRKYKYQILATLAVNIITFAHGHSVAWSAIAIPLLQSENSPMLSGPITVEEASWIGSLVCAGGFIGNLLFGMLMKKIGRKKCLLLITIPHVGTWLFLMYGNVVWQLYVCRTLSGMTGGGLYVTIPTYIADIASNKIRGRLGSTFIFFINGGMLSGYILGSYISYSLFPRILIGFSVIYLLAIIYLPDAPQYFITIKEYDKAENSLRFYRNFKGATKEECSEFHEYFRNLRNTIEGTEEAKQTSLSYHDFVKPVAAKGLLTGLGVALLNPLSGFYAVTIYTATFFQMSGSTIDPNLSTIIIGAVQLFGTFISTILVDRVGRKALLALSSGGVAIGYIVIALFSYFNRTHDMSSLSWLAVASISFSVLLASFGLIPLPYVVLTEVLPQKIKDVSITFCICSLSIIGFIVLKIYPIMMVTIGIDGVMSITAGITAVGAILIYLYLPETKGRCLEKNEEIF